MILTLKIIGGLVVLVLGADWLVRGASRLALALGVPALIIGLTVVAFGTSAPELAVSVRAALAGEAGVGLGNIFGSNTINVLLVLGLSAAVTRLPVSDQLLRIDVPFLIVVSCGVYLMALDSEFSRVDGLLLVLGLILYLSIQVYLGKTRKEVQEEFDESQQLVEKEPEKLSIGWAVAYCVLGFVMLVAGANYLVEGAVTLATNLKISEDIVGLTIVSIGTSMPEIVTSVVAAAQGKRDMAIGNVIGSNLLNLLAVLGVASSVSPEVIPISSAMLRVDIPMMVFVAAICLPIFRTGREVSRVEGIGMLLTYAGYLTYQIIQAVMQRA